MSIIVHREKNLVPEINTYIIDPSYVPQHPLLKNKFEPAEGVVEDLFKFIFKGLTKIFLSKILNKTHINFPGGFNIENYLYKTPCLLHKKSRHVLLLQKFQRKLAYILYYIRKHSNSRCLKGKPPKCSTKNVTWIKEIKEAQTQLACESDLCGTSKRKRVQKALSRAGRKVMNGIRKKIQEISKKLDKSNEFFLNYNKGKNIPVLVVKHGNDPLSYTKIRDDIYDTEFNKRTMGALQNDQKKNWENYYNDDTGIIERPDFVSEYDEFMDQLSNEITNNFIEKNFRVFKEICDKNWDMCVREDKDGLNIFRRALQSWEDAWNGGDVGQRENVNTGENVNSLHKPESHEIKCNTSAGGTMWEWDSASYINGIIRNKLERTFSKDENKRNWYIALMSINRLTFGNVASTTW